MAATNQGDIKPRIVNEQKLVEVLNFNLHMDETSTRKKFKYK